MFRYLLMAAAFVLLAVCVWQLWSTDNIAGLFIENRFSYPVSYPNNAAALFLVAFWPLMWLAAGPEERAPVRGVALGLATGLLGLAIMTQSRGAIWSLAITLVLTFIVSPARLRTLFYLMVPALLMVYEFPNLNRYWLEGPEARRRGDRGAHAAGGVDHRGLHRNDPRPARAMGEGEPADEGHLRHRGPCRRGGGVVYGSIDSDQRRGRSVQVGIADLAAVHAIRTQTRIDTGLRSRLPLHRGLPRAAG